MNWDERLEWDNPDYTDALEPMYYSESDRIFNKKEIDSYNFV